MDRIRYRYLDIFRAVLCLAVLAYHLGILKGGYLAVCGFFVLSGYLSADSLSSRDDIKLGRWYWSRFKRLYLPLLITALITVGVISLFPGIIWVSLKPETTSVLLGYDNFWQISANADYFARRAESPFTHLWYIAILLQFELVFPPFFLLLKKAFGSKKDTGLMHVSALLAVAGIAAFFVISARSDMITTYYSTLSRAFSLMIGVFACMWKRYIGTKRPFGVLKTVTSRVLFAVLTGVMTAAFFFADASGEYFTYAMLGVSVLSVFIIYLSVSSEREGAVPGERLFGFISGISYELYLIQYLFIYLGGFMDPSKYARPVLIAGEAALSVLSAVILRYAFSSVRAFGKKRMAASVMAALLIFSVFGGYKYVIAEDHTEEMALLREQIAENEALMQQKQEEYALRMQQEADDWEKMLLQLENDEAGLEEMVRSMPITVIADSVMAGASDVFTETFTNVYMDAVIGRLIMSATAKAEELEQNGMLAPCVILHIGTNGDGPDEYKEEMMTHLTGCEAVFWIGCSNDWGVHVNDEYKGLAEKYENTHYIDWEGVSAGHSEYFYDGLHLNEKGKHVYTDLIYESVLEVYREIFRAKKEQILSEHARMENEKVSFYGNDLVLGICSRMGGRLAGSGYYADGGWNAQDVTGAVREAVSGETVTHRVVLGFDGSVFVSEEEYADIAAMLRGREVYVIATNSRTADMELSPYGITVIDLTGILKDHPEYLTADGIHLTDEGNTAAAEAIEDLLWPQEQP